MGCPVPILSSNSENSFLVGSQNINLIESNEEVPRTFLHDKKSSQDRDGINKQFSGCQR